MAKNVLWMTFPAKKSIDSFLLHFKECFGISKGHEVAFLWSFGRKTQNPHDRAPLNAEADGPCFTHYWKHPLSISLLVVRLAVEALFTPRLLCMDLRHLCMAPRLPCMARGHLCMVPRLQLMAKVRLQQCIVMLNVFWPNFWTNTVTWDYLEVLNGQFFWTSIVRLRW